MPKGQSKMGNPEKLVAQGTHDEDIQNETTTQYVETNTNNVNKTQAPSTNNWKQSRSKHLYYAEIVTDITSRNSECKET